MAGDFLLKLKEALCDECENFEGMADIMRKGREKVEREHKHEGCGGLLKQCPRQSAVGHWVGNMGQLLIRRPKARDCSSFFEAKLTVRKPSTGSTVGETGDDGGQRSEEAQEEVERR